MEYFHLIYVKTRPTINRKLNLVRYIIPHDFYIIQCNEIVTRICAGNYLNRLT